MATKAQHNRDLLKMALRLSDRDYDTIVFDTGMEYLDVYMSDDNQSRVVLMGLAEYWKWWQRTFDQRNAHFIAEQHLYTWAPTMDSWERAKLLQYFHGVHSAELMELRPARHVMQVVMKELRKRVRK